VLAAALAYLGDAGIAAPRSKRRSKRRGRRAHDRLSILRAMLAKSFLNLVSTRQLLEQLHHDAALRQLCGWNSSQHVPSESVFSRVWAEWSGSEWVAQLQAGVIAEVYRDRLVGHVIRDATPVPVRERCRRKAAPPVKRRRGRPPKGHRPLPKNAWNGSLECSCQKCSPIFPNTAIGVPDSMSGAASNGGKAISCIVISAIASCR
jgi:hypothetical protein